MPELRLENLKVAHLDPVNLSVRPGEIICFSGESGAGKSLLLRAIADLIPHEGQVHLDNKSYLEFSAPDWRRKVGLLPAESQWWWDVVGEHFQSPDADSIMYQRVEIFF